LYHRLNFTTIFHTVSNSLSKKKHNSPFVIVVAALKETILIKKRLYAVLGLPALEEIFANCFRDEHG
jgi:hypothetical protein